MSQVFNLADLIRAAPQVSRRMRRPKHHFAVQFRPTQLQPFMIAPVLPGETLKKATLEGRVITDPLALGFGNILPWWCEQWFFYVRLMDLDARQEFVDMALSNDPVTGLASAASAVHYHNGNGINYTKLCLERVVKTWFRDEDEPITPLLDGLPQNSVIKRKSNLLDSYQVDGTIPVNNDFQNPEGERDPLAGHAEAYERMRAMRMIDMTYEEYLESYGVQLNTRVEENKPELIRFASNWTYPSNTIDPVTGIPTGAASWSISESADKDRLFKYPGFLIGIMNVRPKVYMGNQTGSASHALVDAHAWMPPEFRDRPEARLKEFTTVNGPVANQTTGYWVDLSDLHRYGDQFVSGMTGGFLPAIPTPAGEMRYLTGAQIDLLYSAPGANKVRADGKVSLNILGHASTASDMT